MNHLFVEAWGDGTPVVLVHGSLATGSDEWQAQRPLAGQSPYVANASLGWAPPAGRFPMRPVPLPGRAHEAGPIPPAPPRRRR